MEEWLAAHIVQLDTHGGYWCGLSQGALRLSRSHRFREDFPARQPVRAAADQAPLLSVMVQAYTAMDGLMTHGEDALERASTRAVLGSLMRALNGEMELQVERLVSLTSVLCTQVTDRTDGVRGRGWIAIARVGEIPARLSNGGCRLI